MTRLFSCAILATTMLVSSGAWAATDHCDTGLANIVEFFTGEDLNNRGDVNKLAKDVFGTPGQQTTFLPPNEFAHVRNFVRNELLCPPN
jgi:hypothetical protein